MIFVALDSYNAEKLQDLLFALYFILVSLSTLVGPQTGVSPESNNL